MAKNPKLTVVASTSTGQPPPRKLGQHGLSLDRAEALAAAIDADGETIKGKNGLRAHPCLKDELAARSFVVRTLARLGITTESVKPMGRPSPGFGVSHAD